MNAVQSKSDIIRELESTATAITQSSVTMPSEQFMSGTSEDWSPADYLKHLILSVKPFAKGLLLPPEQLAEMFGKSDGQSKTYERLTEIYNQGLARGVRAEDSPPVVPVNYRMPDGIDDEQAYLVETWQEAISRLLSALENWNDEDLDWYQMPHPALGILTLREMLFFTVHHNQMHYGDITRDTN